MDDQTSAFTCDDGFFESAWTGDDDVIHTAVNALMPPDATRNNDTIGASNNAIYYRRTNILTTTSCEESSVGANLQAVESHPETLVNAISCEKSDYDSVGSVGRCFSRIEPETSDQRNSAESDSATSPAGMTENLVLGGMGLGISQDPVCASALDGCAVKAAADSEEDVPPIVLQAYKAAQKTQGEAEDDLAEKALEGENTASDVLCPSPRRKTYRPMRPSRGVHPIDDSQPFAERRLAPPLRPSRGVQPMISQKIALSVVIETASDPRAVVPRVTDSSLMEFSSSESGYVSPPVSRKRATAEETSETAKRVRQSDEALVSQNLRPRRPTRTSNEDAHSFKYDYGSVERKVTVLERDIDDLDIQLRKEVKALQRRLRQEIQEAEDRFKKQHREIAEKVHTEISDLEDKFRLKSKALQTQLDEFKVDLNEAGLVDLYA